MKYPLRDLASAGQGRCRLGSFITVDPDGVAMAAIQGLNEELKDELEARDRKIDELVQQLKRQQTMIEALRKFVCSQSPQADACKENK